MPPNNKCVVMGHSSAGKTSLLRTYIDKTFYADPFPTAYDEYVAEAIANDGSVVELHVCDTSGLESYDHISRLSYPNTDVFVICFSVVDAGNFGQIRQRWLPQIEQHCPDVPILLVGTKVDLREDEEYLHRWQLTPISYEQGMLLAQEIGAIEYMECSALNWRGVSAIFDVVASCALHYRSKPDKVMRRKSRCSIS